MKKIFSFLMMFLILGNFAFAQSGIATVQPKLNFQAVVRDANNQLLFNDEMSVQINITYGSDVYTETHPSVMTNQNGLMSLIIGDDGVTDVSGSLADVNWAVATIEAVITYTTDPVTVTDIDGNVTTSAGTEATITVSAPVTAVPYALQAGPSKLTTDMIVEYLYNAKWGINGTPEEKYDALAISDALRNNPYGLKNALKDSIINYLKTHKSIAESIFKSYLEQTTPEDVQDAYDHLMSNTAAHERIRLLAKNYIKTHKEDAAEIAEYYAEHATIDDITPLYEAAQNNPDLMSTVKKYVKQHLKEYLEDHDYVKIESCPTIEICAIANQGKTCPAADFIGTTTLLTDGKLQTTITNPEDLSLEVTYDVSYQYYGETVYDTYVGAKESMNVLKSLNAIPAEATNITGTVTIHAYGCDASYDRTATFNF